MIYNLFKKEAAPTWQEAKLKLITSQSFDENRIGKKYDKAFPPGYKYAYDEKNHFVYEGDLTEPYIIQSDFTLYFLNDREQIEKGYRVLRIGEILEEDKIKTIPSPGMFYEWEGMEWVLNIEAKRRSLFSEIEIEKGKLLENGFLWKGEYQQRCRAEKDLPYIRETLENFDLIPNYSLKWYFSNLPEGYSFSNKEEFLELRNNGMIFTGEVFKMESELKFKINSAITSEDLTLNIKEEYKKGLVGFILPE
ncbi:MULTISPECIES: hypothetical protein [Psychrilyobacter]|uniref:Uncharacterized protein n=1 Tax=Psychrilyobacter piezotolerans TaxID=2293438 RepID=A0ABX9KJT8_9FUSO|nr:MULTISPECIES: hypothetical protein [Psychrilyobacter]MCS5421238.1 hypothetical protein [Psychrilyobacter sp. S5]NDI77005.1 hypothetical protein [Psychrilyobacter piezotolerans]RDE64622.1 hypothetical protein DV867_03515 [Psychrilyobacter sp. S5]REI42434.1 hypothetical protein DYH56_03515 [Psychrilyobacter piezotolerans]